MTWHRTTVDLCRESSEALSEDIRAELSSEWKERVSQARTWRKSPPGTRKSRCKGPGVGMSRARERKRKDSVEAEAQCVVKHRTAWCGTRSEMGSAEHFRVRNLDLILLAAESHKKEPQDPSSTFQWLLWGEWKSEL